MSCTAHRDGGDWVVNGTKHFISGADHADFFIVFVATGVDETPKGPKKRITCFLVDRGHPGFTMRDGYQSVSHRGYKNCILEFDDCRLPDAQVLGEVDGGFAVMNTWLYATRLTVAAFSRRPRAALFRSRRGLCRRALAVRPADREVPGRELPGGRHDHRDRRRRLADAVRGMAAGPRACPPTARSRAPSSMPPRCWRGSPTRRCRSSAAWG
jgi:alkylation response protein AidB-like acyl-CoA dehydrogenase